jgi:hypothetical protein
MNQGRVLSNALNTTVGFKRNFIISFTRVA